MSYIATMRTESDTDLRPPTPNTSKVSVRCILLERMGGLLLSTVNVNANNQTEGGKMIDFSKSKFTKADHKTVKTIVDRVEKLASLTVDRLSVMMDIEAANMVIELDLDKLAGFDDFNLTHDVVGITNHLNRDTGELEDCFVPRCSK